MKLHTIVSARVLAGALLTALVLLSPVAANEIPSHPSELSFPDLVFDTPVPDPYRSTLSNGTVFYEAVSTELPLVEIQFRFRGGTYLDPVGKEGLVSMMATQMRRGGTASVKAKEFDERIDFLATQTGVGASQYFVTATLNCLATNIDESCQLFFDMIRNPGFQEDRLKLYKEEVLESLKQRNDSADSILDREWSALMYGREHFKGRAMTKASLDSITVSDLQAMHKKLIQPEGMIIGITGDFDPLEMRTKFENLLKGWAKGEKLAPPADTDVVVKPGVYHVEKDITQGKVYLGHRGVELQDPDYIAIMVMDRILGASGFTSRITRRVRSDEGLAYSAGARMSPGLYFPGEFRALFQSKNRSVALAIKLILEEVEKIRKEPVTEQELQVAKDNIIESFPSRFGSRANTVGMFIDEEARGRSWEFWETYREKVKAVTADDILRAAQKHLSAEKLAIMVVGNWAEIAPGDLEGRAKMADFFNGEVEHLPLRDPLTLEPIKVD